MAYRVQIRRWVAQQIASWQLPNDVLVDVYVILREELPRDPGRYLRRLREPFDGMVCGFSLPDPSDRLCEHHFFFHVFYGPDEETLWVARGGYLRQTSL
jgi:hypothetical protein